MLASSDCFGRTGEELWTFISSQLPPLWWDLSWKKKATHYTTRMAFVLTQTSCNWFEGYQISDLSLIWSNLNEVHSFFFLAASFVQQERAAAIFCLNHTPIIIIQSRRLPLKSCPHSSHQAVEKKHDCFHHLSPNTVKQQTVYSPANLN